MNDPIAMQSSRFQCLTLRAKDLATAERALAECVEAGAAGAEQRESEAGVTLLLYVPAPAMAAVRRSARAVVGLEPIGEATELESVDWSERWKEGLRAVEISERLRIRPPFDSSEAAPGQLDLVIEPGQAFGTGGHESTRLALEWLDALRTTLPTARLLDVGVGSGVLSLAALALGASRAFGFDLDPLAASAAVQNARLNRLTTGLGLFTGPLDALKPGTRFDGVLANLLRTELEPLLPKLVTRIQVGGWLVVSGLLANEVERVCALTNPLGLRLEGTRSARDTSGAEWVAALMRPALR